MGSEGKDFRRGFLSAFWIAALLSAGSALAASRPPVAILKSSSIAPFEQATAAIIDALRRDPLQPEILTFDLEGDAANGEKVLAEVHRAGPRLVITVGSLATATALKDATSLPVVFSMVLYPRQSGFLESPSRPVSGASLDIPPEETFRYLRRLLPAARRIGVLYHPEETGLVIEEAEHAAPAYGFTLVTAPVSAPAQAVAVLEAVMEKVEVVWSVADSHVFTPQTTSTLILAALRRGIPLFGLSTAHVRAGAVASLSADYADVGKQTAEIALRALRGEDLRNIPVSSPRVVNIALNARTAGHMGLSFPRDLEAEAAEVFR